MDKYSLLQKERVPKAVLDVVLCLQDKGYDAYLVGGGVRDILRSESPVPIHDWDIATSARPEMVQTFFRKVVPTGIRHGTVSVLTGCGPVEVTTFRGESGYSDARHPDSVCYFDRVEKDLARRDFTVNAIAWNPLSGVIVDPFDGLKDLENKILRAVGDPLKRFTEDGLRPMRAVRFACVLKFRMDPATENSIPVSIGSFKKIAMERIRQELEKILVADMPSTGLELLFRTGLLNVFLPEISALEEDDRTLNFSAVDAAAPDRGFNTRLALMLRGCLSNRSDISNMLRRLRFSNNTISVVCDLLDSPQPDKHNEMNAADMRRLLSKTGKDRAGDISDFWRAFALAGADENAKRKAFKAASLLEYEAGLERPLVPADLAISGKDIQKEMNIGSGPDVGRIMSLLMEEVLEEPAKNEPVYLRKLLKKLAVKKTGSGFLQ